MKDDLIIVADLGLLRAYRVIQGFTDRQPHLELLEELQPPSAHEKLSDQVADQSGRFPRGSGAGNIAGDLSAGERHDLEEEQQRRLIRQLADRINELLEDGNVDRCSIAASAPIHRQLYRAIDAPARIKIGQVLPLDLTKVQPKDLLCHFQTSVP
jgi:hypothetical protein